jgi:hypothetical protein
MLSKVACSARTSGALCCCTLIIFTHASSVVILKVSMSSMTSSCISLMVRYSDGMTMSTAMIAIVLSAEETHTAILTPSILKATLERQ